MKSSIINKYVTINGITLNETTKFFLLPNGQEYITDSIDVSNVATKTIFYSTKFINNETTVTFHIEYSYDNITWFQPDASVTLNFSEDGNFELSSSTFIKLNDYIPYIRLRFESCTEDYTIQIKICGISLISKYTHAPTWGEEEDTFYLLTETGDYVLTESGDKIILG